MTLEKKRFEQMDSGRKIVETDREEDVSSRKKHIESNNNYGREKSNEKNKLVSNKSYSNINTPNYKRDSRTNNENKFDFSETNNKNSILNKSVDKDNDEFEFDGVRESKMSRFSKRENEKELPKTSNSNNKDEFDVQIEENKNEPINNVKSARLDSIEAIIKEQPDLKKIPKEFKLMVLKRIIPVIDKYSKGIKPGNLVYSAKLLSTINKHGVKTKFLEILSYIHSNDETFDITTIDINVLLLMVSDIINTNIFMNLNPENIKLKEFNENYFDSDLNDDVRETYHLVNEHMKKMIQDKKTTLPIATNFLAESLMNFDKNDTMLSRVLAVLEKKLNQKKAGGIELNKAWGGFSSK